MPTERIPLVGSVFHRNWADSDTLPAISTLDQRFVNVTFKKVTNVVTGKTAIWACKRPGIDAGTTLSATGLSPCYAAAQSVHSGAGSNLNSLSVYGVDVDNIGYFSGNTRVDTETATGQFDASRLCVYEVNGSGTPSVAFRVNATSRAAYAFEGSTIAAISDVDFPNSSAIGNFVYKDGYLFIMTNSTGRIHNSDLNAVTAWSATSFLTTDSGNDGCSLALYHDKIVAFGGTYIEFYENVGNAIGSPLQQVRHLRINGYGLGRSNVIPASYGQEPGHRCFSSRDTLFWINNPDLESGGGVFVLDAFTPKKISTAEVDFDLARLAYSDPRIAGICELFGFNYLVIATGNQSTDYCWVFCFETGMWTTWESSLFSTLAAVMNNPQGSGAGQDSVLLFSGNEIYQFDTASLLSTAIDYTDDSAAFTMTVQTGQLDFGTNRRKRLNSIRLIGNDPREASTCAISWSDDDGQTYSTARNVDLNDEDPKLVACGMFRRRQFRIANSSNAPCELEAMELDYEVLAS